MESSDMKKCPYCAESINKDAIKCRYCGSILTGSHVSGASRQHWSRIPNGKKIAGVCTGIAAELNAPQLLLPLRLFFLISILFGGFGILLYIILWILMPSSPHVPLNNIPNSTGNTHHDIATPAQRDSLTGIVSFLLLTVLLIAVVYLINPMIHTLRLPGLPLFYDGWHHFNPGIFDDFRIFPWPPPTLVVLIIGVTILFLLSFRMFRTALGCLGALVALIILAILIPVAIPVIAVFFGLALPFLLLVGVILGIIFIIKALLD